MGTTQLFRNDQDFVNQYLKEIRGYKQLEREEERALLMDFHKTASKTALHTLITSNLRFVVSVAIKYQNQGLAMPELINEGNLGLIEATRRFNPANFSVKFISYAVWWIRQSIVKALYETSRLVRVSAEKESKMKTVHRFVELSLQEFGRIDYDYVESKAETRPGDVEQILSLSSNRVSLDAPLGEDNETTVSDILADDQTEAPDEFLERDGTRQSVNTLLNTLNPQEQTVVSAYFGIDADTESNLEQIGRRLRLSKERVRQIKKRALEKMREFQFQLEPALAPAAA